MLLRCICNVQGETSTLLICCNDMQNLRLFTKTKHFFTNQTVCLFSFLCVLPSIELAFKIKCNSVCVMLKKKNLLAVRNREKKYVAVAHCFGSWKIRTERNQWKKEDLSATAHDILLMLIQK